MKNYDFSKVPDYTKRQMFLDPAGPVTVQRFEEVAYPRIQKFENIARGFFWVPEEISLTKDKSDFKHADDATKFVFTNTLIRQSALDSLQGRAPSQVFTPVCSVPELEALVSNWSFFETNIHSASYSHIIRNVYSVPKAQFDAMHDVAPIIKMASNIGRCYDQLHELNSRKELGLPVSEKEHIKAIWIALNGSLALEFIRFLTSFAVSFALAENRIFIGNSAIINLILADETLHGEWTSYIINQVLKDDPRFREVSEECKDEVFALYEDVVREEKEWADFLFQHGVVVGLNAEILKKFIDYTTTYRLKGIGLKWSNPVKTNPLPWFDKYLNISKKQTALQEQENTSYVVGVMGADIDVDSLPDL